MSDMSNLKGYDEWAAYLYLNTLPGKKEIGWDSTQPVPLERVREFIQEGIANGNGKQFAIAPAEDLTNVPVEEIEIKPVFSDGWTGDDSGDGGDELIETDELYSNGSVTININIYQRGAE